jgi:hypothetical protein
LTDRRLLQVLGIYRFLGCHEAWRSSSKKFQPQCDLIQIAFVETYGFVCEQAEESVSGDFLQIDFCAGEILEIFNTEVSNPKCNGPLQ